MIENSTHRDAFEFYYSLGTQNRNLEKVAKQFKVSEASTHLWSQEFNWQERIFLRDKKVADGIETKVDSKIIEEKAKMLNTNRAAMNLFIKGLAPERITKYKDPETGIEKEVFTPAIEVNSVSDWEKLVNIYFKLIGEDSGDIDSFKRRDLAKQDLINRINNITGRLALKDDDKPDSDSTDSPA